MKKRDKDKHTKRKDFEERDFEREQGKTSEDTGK